MEFDSSDNVWFDPNSKASQNKLWVESIYQPVPGADKLLVYAKDGGSVFRKNIWDELFQLTEDVKEIEVSPDQSPTGKVCKLQDVCMTLGDECLQEGVTGFFQHDIDHYKRVVTSDADIAEAVRVKLWPGVGGEVPHDELFGKLKKDAEGLPHEATAMRVNWKTTGECAAAWEQEYHRFFMGDQRVRVTKQFEHIDVQIMTEISGADEIERSVHGDITTIYVVFGLMFLVTVNVLGSPPCVPPLSLVRQRSLLAFAEILMLAIAIGAGYGMSFLCGIPFTLLAQILPFVLMGIGIDDAMVISAAFDATDEDEDIVDRIEIAMSRVGVSITFTSLTDIIAFGLGCLTRLPAVRYFSIMGLWCLVFIYIFHVTGFVALLALDSRRQHDNRFDILFCAKKSNPSPDPIHSLSRRTMKKFAELIIMEKAQVRFFVLVVFLASFIVSLHTLINDMPTGFKYTDVAPDQSFLRDMYRKEEEFFGVPSSDDNIPATMYFTKQPLHTASFQSAVFKAVDDLQQLDSVRVDKNASFWLAEWIRYVDVRQGRTIGSLGYDFPNALEHDLELVVNCPAQYGPATWHCRPHFVGEKMLDSVKEWLTHDYVDAEKTFENGTKVIVSRAWGGKRFQNDIIFNDDGNGIEYFRVHAYHENMQETEDLIAGINEVETFYAHRQEEFPGLVVFNPVYRMFDHYRIILPELLETFGFVVLAVAVVSPCILVHPLSVIIVVVVVVMTFVNLFACLRLWGLEINSLTGAILVCSIGLVVDYCAHICHSFSIQYAASRQERVVGALFEIGAPVAVGLLTTGVSLVPLAFALSETYRIFFRIGVSMVVVGGMHGLVFCPVLLSFIGPQISRRAMEFHDGTKTAMTNIRKRTGDRSSLGAAAAKAAAECPDSESLAKSGTTTASKDQATADPLGAGSQAKSNPTIASSQPTVASEAPPGLVPQPGPPNVSKEKAAAGCTALEARVESTATPASNAV